MLLLHLLLQPQGAAIPMKFHYPIFWQFGEVVTEELEKAVLERADEMLERLRKSEVTNIAEAISEILKWHLPLSDEDKDLTVPFLPQDDTASQSPLLPDTGTKMGGEEDELQTRGDSNRSLDTGTSGRVAATTQDARFSNMGGETSTAESKGSSPRGRAPGESRPDEQSAEPHSKNAAAEAKEAADSLGKSMRELIIDE